VNTLLTMVIACVITASIVAIIGSHLYSSGISRGIVIGRRTLQDQIAEIVRKEMAIGPDAEHDRVMALIHLETTKLRNATADLETAMAQQNGTHL
jgi:uncharacterized membrane protein